MSRITNFTRIASGMILLAMIGTASALTLDQGDWNNSSKLQAKQQSTPVQLHNAWVEPYLERIQIKDNSTRQDSRQVIKVWIMADDQQGSKIYFNQVSKKFGLAHYQPGERSFTYTKSEELHNPDDVFQSRD